ncbi:MAG: hypothetical protein RL148_1338 [Planctomycetota bacterium]
MNPGLLSTLLALAAAALLPGLPAAQGKAVPGEPTGVAAAPRAPLCFLPNGGQWDAAVRHALRGSGADGWVHDDGFTLRWQHWESAAAGAARTSRGAVVRLRLEGGSAKRIRTEQPLPGVHHVLVGDDRSRHATGLRGHGVLVLDEVLPGVGMRLRAMPAAEGAIEYDLLLAPGADLRTLRMCVEGAGALAVEADGSLRTEVRLTDGSQLSLRQPPPVVWQEQGTRRVPVRCTFRLLDATSYGFEAVGVDPALPLVVDPGIVWSSFLGGSASDAVNDVEWVPGVGVFCGGWASASDFPTTTGAFQRTGSQDGFVACFAEDGTTLLHATYLGGSGAEEVRGIAVDAQQRIVAVGFTNSTSFPVTAGAFQPAYRGASSFLQVGDGFVARLGTGGSTLVGSTYLGGFLDDVAEAVAVDALGHALVAGWAASPDLPVTPGAFQPGLGGALTGQTDGFVARIAPDARSATYVTYLGGGLPDQLLGIAVDTTGNAVVCGRSQSANYPTSLQAYRPSNAGGTDMVLTRLNANGTALGASTYLGGLAADSAQDVVVAADGSLWVGGSSESANFPTTGGAVQPTHGGRQDAVLVRFDANATQLLWSSYLGGSGDDAAHGIAVDPSGRVVAVGNSGGGLPVTGSGANATYGGSSSDGFAVVLEPASANPLQWLSFLGGSEVDLLLAVSAPVPGMFVCGGATWSANWPTTAGSFQTAMRGSADGVVAMVDLLADLGSGVQVLPPLPLPETVFLPAGSTRVLGATLRNVSPRSLSLRSLQLFVGGSADNVQHLAHLVLWRDDPATGPWADQLLAGPAAVPVDNATVQVVLASPLTLAPGAEAVVWVEVVASPSCPAGAQFAVSIPDYEAWELAAVGTVQRVPRTGTSFVQGLAVSCVRVPDVDGDADGDGAVTVSDMRRLCAQLGGPASGVDPDGNGFVTTADLAIVQDRILRRPIVRSAPSVVVRGTTLTIAGFGLAGGTPTAVLGNRILPLRAASDAELSFLVDTSVVAGSAELRVTLGDRVILQQQVPVQ